MVKSLYYLKLEKYQMYIITCVTPMMRRGTQGDGDIVGEQSIIFIVVRDGVLCLFK